MIPGRPNPEVNAFVWSIEESGERDYEVVLCQKYRKFVEQKVAQNAGIGELSPRKYLGESPPHRVF